jgi:hypothetical protein
MTISVPVVADSEYEYEPGHRERDEAADNMIETDGSIL